MYAIIQTGGKQYKVEVGDEVLVEKLDAEIGTEYGPERRRYDLGELLLAAGAQYAVLVDQVTVDRAAFPRIAGEVLPDGRGVKPLQDIHSCRRLYGRGGLAGDAGVDLQHAQSPLREYGLHVHQCAEPDLGRYGPADVPELLVIGL